MKVILGITTYNRMKTLKYMVDSLYASDLSEIDYEVRVYDDCSDEYNADAIRELFKEDVFVFRSEENHGSDYNIGLMYRDFLNTDGDILFNCDSDLIFDKNWLKKGLSLLPKTDGVLSLFNTPAHKTINDEDQLCQKETIGSAGTFMTREVVDIICSHIGEHDTYTALDFNWSKLLISLGKSIYVTKRSYVQHIGIDGYNSKTRIMDVGRDFNVNTDINGQILGDILYDLYSEERKSDNTRLFYYLFPFDRIKSGKRIIIYGAGRVGQDYAEQLKMSHYSESFVMVDRQYKELKNVSSPELLREADVDYVVVAAHHAMIRESMKKDILEINPKLSAILVDNVCYSIRLD